jgi:hypothetical protein
MYELFIVLTTLGILCLLFAIGALIEALYWTWYYRDGGVRAREWREWVAKHPEDE